MTNYPSGTLFALHIVRGEYPVKPGLIIGHEPVGVIKEFGPGVTGFQVGDRVLADIASTGFISWLILKDLLTSRGFQMNEEF